MTIELSKRAIGVLSGLLKGREVTRRAVARLSEEQVLLQPGCGRETLLNIERWLLANNLTLRWPDEFFIPPKSEKARDLLWLAERRRNLALALAWQFRHKWERRPATKTERERIDTALRSMWTSTFNAKRPMDETMNERQRAFARRDRPAEVERMLMLIRERNQITDLLSERGGLPGEAVEPVLKRLSKRSSSERSRRCRLK